MNPQENVPEEHIFHFQNGDQAHNLQDLRDVIKKMSADEFVHHVDEFNNDFANWVEFVSKDLPLADDLRQVMTQKATVEVLDAELGKYSLTSNLQKKESKQLHEDPITPTAPPQSIQMPDGEIHHTVATHATHHFIVKEFMYGLALGLVVGLVLMGILMRLGAF